MSGHQWKSDYSVWVVVNEDFGISIHETRESAQSWAGNRPGGTIVRSVRVQHETDRDWNPMTPRPSWVKRLLGNVEQS